jgi:NADH-quinone oxidoreductase subunit J
VAAAGDLDRPGHPLRGAAGGYRLCHPRSNDQGIDGTIIDAKAVGISLFGPYVLAVELASMLLLAGLVVAFHVGREDRQGEVLSNRVSDAAQAKKENA